MKGARKAARMELYLVVQKDGWKAGTKVGPLEQQLGSLKDLQWELQSVQHLV